VAPGREDAVKDNTTVNREARVDMHMDVDWIRFSRPRPHIDWQWQAQVREHPLADASLADGEILSALGA
jgi:hypothetical protein